MQNRHFSSNIFFIILWLVSPMDAARYFTVELGVVNLTVFDPVKSYHYNIYDRKVVYVDFISSSDINEFDINLNLDMIRKNNQQTSVMNLKLSGCKALENAQKVNLLKILSREIFRVSNVPRKCPILKDKLYVFKNFTLRDDDFPVITPIVEWQLQAEFVTGKGILARGIVNGRVRKL